MYARSGFGRIQVGERCTEYTCDATLATSGSTCDAVDPVPSTATRAPARSTEWSQFAVCITTPENGSSSSRSGSSGWLKMPTADTRMLNRCRSPVDVLTCQVCVSASQAADVTSVFSFRCEPRS